MNDNRPILAAALLAIVIFGALTVAVVIRNGPDPLTILSVLVLALFGFGIVGALRQPPE